MNIDLRKFGLMTYVLCICDNNWKQSFVMIITEEQFKKILANYLFQEIEADHFRFTGFF